MAKVWAILTKSGRLRARHEGTKLQAIKWANSKFIKGSFDIIHDKEFEKKWKWRYQRNKKLTGKG